jgi:hypothetical protein
MSKVLWSVLAIAALLVPVNALRADDAKKDKETLEDRIAKRNEDLQDAYAGKDFDKVLSVLDEMIADKELSDEYRYQVRLLQLETAVEEMQDGPKASTLAKKIAAMKGATAGTYNELAWILVSKGLQKVDFDVAMDLAKKAVEASKSENPLYLDTLARVYFEKGDLDNAIVWQTKAVDKLGNLDKNEKVPEDDKGQLKSDIKDKLQEYKDKKAEKK